MDAIAFDDRDYKDEWQQDVYRSAQALAMARGYHHVADFGCGSAYKLVKFFRHCNTVGYELEPTLSYLRETYPDRNWQDGAAIPTFPCDLFICADVLEHMLFPEQVLEQLTRSKFEYAFFSTPALDILADRGRSWRLGPPDNQAHINEWTTSEFSDFVGRYLVIVEHAVVNVKQGTQMIVAKNANCK